MNVQMTWQVGLRDEDGRLRLTHVSEARETGELRVGVENGFRFPFRRREQPRNGLARPDCRGRGSSAIAVK